MLRIVVSPNAAAAKRYFNDGLSIGDYFLGDDNTQGLWGGKGAALLGLSGKVGRDEFFRLCENLHPTSGEPLTPRTKANRRVAYDINFHCPKSVSVLHALTGDPAIRASFLRAVEETMSLIEGDAKTRVRARGAQSDRATGNLVWATFVHETARPIDGIPDPHLHAHSFTFNATYDDAERRWKAAQFGDVKRDGRYFEACFHARFAGLMRECGYGVVRRGDFWEVAGMPDTVVARFSRRTAEIDAIAARRGITDPAERASLGARTRRSKTEALPHRDVQAAWRARLTPDEAAALGQVKTTGEPRFPAREARIDAVDEAVRRCFERASVVTERAVIERALRAGVGTVSIGDACDEIAGRRLPRREIDGRVLVTTPATADAERAAVAFARDGRGRHRPLGGSTVPTAPPELRPDQATAFGDMLASRDRVVLIRGPAGRLQDAFASSMVDVIASSGTVVSRFECDAKANRGPHVDTLLNGEHRLQRGGLLWLDGAGNLGVNALSQVFKTAGETGSRVVLSADWRDQTSVHRGDGLRVLEGHAGLTCHGVANIRRETEERRRVMTAVDAGQVSDGIRGLVRIGAVQEIGRDQFIDAAASDYVRTVRKGKSALVVAPDNTDRVTETIRGQLRQKKFIGRGRSFERLDRLRLTDHDRSEASRYERGQVVVFYKAAKGFKAGHRYQVMGRDPFGNVLARKGAWIEALPLSKSDRFGVFRRSKIELAKGDVVRTTAAGRTKNESFGMEKLLSKRRQAIRLKNMKTFGPQPPDRRYRVPKDSVYRISGFTLSGDIKLDNGWVLPKDFGHLAHGYSVDMPPAGGKRFDRVIGLATSPGNLRSIVERISTSVRETLSLYVESKSVIESAIEIGDRMPTKSATSKEPGDRPGTFDRIEPAIEVKRRENERER